jgi:hypothetical protein
MIFEQPLRSIVLQSYVAVLIHLHGRICSLSLKATEREDISKATEISQTGRDQTHVDAPEETNTAEEDNPPFPWNEGEADDRCDRPDSVASHDDRNRLVSDRLADRYHIHTLQDANYEQEGDGVQDCSHCNAVDKPLGDGVLLVELGLRWLQLHLLLGNLVTPNFLCQLDVIFRSPRRCSGFVTWPCSLKPALPVVVRRSCDGGAQREAEEVVEIEAERFLKGSVRSCSYVRRITICTTFA